MRLLGPALAIALTGAAAAADTPTLGWSLTRDGTYIHDETGVRCPKKWGRVTRFEMSSKVQGPIVARCRYGGGGDTAEVRIRHFDPTAARDPDTLNKERQLMGQRGNSRSPWGYFIRWDEPVIGSKPLQV